MTLRIILHETIASTLLALVIGTYYANPPKPSSSNESDDDYYQDIAVWLLIQLVAYNAIGCLYIYTSSGRNEKIILSTGFLILVLLSFLVSSFSNKYRRPSFIFWANIMAISVYYYVLILIKIYPWLRSCLLDADDAVPTAATQTGTPSRSGASTPNSVWRHPGGAAGILER